MLHGFNLFTRQGFQLGFKRYVQGAGLSLAAQVAQNQLLKYLNEHNGTPPMEPNMTRLMLPSRKDMKLSAIKT